MNANNKELGCPLNISLGGLPRDITGYIYELLALPTNLQELHAYSILSQAWHQFLMTKYDHLYANVLGRIAPDEVALGTGSMRERLLGVLRRPSTSLVCNPYLLVLRYRYTIYTCIYDDYPYTGNVLVELHGGVDIDTVFYGITTYQPTVNRSRTFRPEDVHSIAIYIRERCSGRRAELARVENVCFDENGSAGSSETIVVFRDGNLARLQVQCFFDVRENGSLEWVEPHISVRIHGADDEDVNVDVPRVAKLVQVLMNLFK